MYGQYVLTRLIFQFMANSGQYSNFSSNYSYCNELEPLPNNTVEAKYLCFDWFILNWYRNELNCI